MSIAAVGTSSDPNALATGSSRIPKKTLGQEEFFKLLSVQLSSQDPMKPMEDTAFIAQMSNFSSLEMMGQLNKNFTTFTDQQSFLSAQSMLGRNVTVQKSGTETISGLATGIFDRDGQTIISVGGADYPVSSVLRVEVAAAE
jgi:flagellar basal-body rod modification protein FlgD